MSIIQLEFTMNAHLMSEIFSKVDFAAERGIDKSAHTALKGVFFRRLPFDNGVHPSHFVATDLKRLAIYEVSEVSNGEKIEFSFDCSYRTALFPLGSLKYLQGFRAWGAEVRVKTEFTQTDVAFYIEGEDIPRNRVKRGKIEPYANYQKFLSEFTSTDFVVLPRATLQKAVLEIGEQTDRTVLFRIDKHTCIIEVEKCAARPLRASENSPGALLRTGFNKRYLYDALNQHDGDEVRLEFSRNTKPMKITSTDPDVPYYSMLMPIDIGGEE